MAAGAAPGPDGEVYVETMRSSALAITEALLAVGSRRARHVIIDAYLHHFHGSGWDAIVRAGLTDLCSLVEERSQIALAPPG